MEPTRSKGLSLDEYEQKVSNSSRFSQERFMQPNYKNNIANSDKNILESQYDTYEIVLLREGSPRTKKAKTDGNQPKTSAILELEISIPQESIPIMKILKKANINLKGKGEKTIDFQFYNQAEVLYEPNMYLIPLSIFIISLTLSFMDETEKNKSLKTTIECKVIEASEMDKCNFDLTKFCEERNITPPRFMLSLQEITFSLVNNREIRVNKNEDFDVFSRSSVNSPDKYSSSPIRFSKIQLSEFFVSNDIQQEFSHGKSQIDNSAEKKYLDFSAFYEQCNTQSGSRIKQKEIERSDQEEINTLIEMLGYDYTAIMIGEYTNYMFTSLIGRCTQAQRIEIIKKISPNIFKIASHSKGTHPLQTLTALTTCEEEQFLLFSAIQDIFPEMILDVHATHFLQKVVIHFNNECFAVIYNVFRVRFLEIINHKVKTIIEKCACPEFQNQIIEIITLITDNLYTIIQDSYGNYAVKKLLESDFLTFPFMQPIIELILAKFSNLACQKFSSFIVEKDFLPAISGAILRYEVIHQICVDRYGGHVLQKLAFALANLRCGLLRELAELSETVFVNLPNNSRNNKFKTLIKDMRRYLY